jgi:hypothetical protein
MPFSSSGIKREEPKLADIWPAIKRAAKLKMNSAQRRKANRIRRGHARSDRATALAGGPAAKARGRALAVRGSRTGARRTKMSAAAYKRSRRQAALKAWRTRKGRSGSR